MTYREGAPLPRILVVAFGGNVVGMDAATGYVVWKAPVDNLGASPPRIHVLSERVIVVVREQAYCLTYATGQTLWRTQLPLVADNLLEVGDRLFVGGSGEVACLDATGRVLWHERFKGFGMGKVALGVPGLVSQGDADS